MIRGAAYLRISKDLEGDQDATTRQRDDCHRFAELRGATIVDEFEDVDLSAYQLGVIRPAYEDLVARVEAGEFDVVIVWRLDRLVRRTVEFARFWTACERGGCQIMSVTQPIDTSDPIGKLIVDILVAFAEMESATMSARLKNKEAAMARAGRPKVAGRRPYGLTADWTEVVDEEAAQIREAADRILSGDTVSAIARSWNDDQVATVTGAPWSRQSVTALMTAPRLWGQRVHLGEIVADGDWPPILDRPTGLAVAQALTSGVRRPVNGAGTTRKYLLSGILRCEKCDHRMTGNHSTRYGLRYVCRSAVDGMGGCGGTTTLMEPTDGEIVAQVLERLSSPKMIEQLQAQRSTARSGQVELLAERTALTRRRDELAEMWATGELASKSAWIAASRKIEAELAVIDERLARVTRPDTALALAGPGVYDRWAEITSLDRKRAVILSVLSSVKVHGAGSDWYQDRLRTALLEEAEEARDAGDMVKAKRRERQAASRAAGGGSWRPERLEPIWR